MKHKNFQIAALLLVMVGSLFSACGDRAGLKTGEIILTENEAFGKVIELKGEKVFTDSMMDPRVLGMLLKNNKLICQYEVDPPFLIVDAPSMKFVGYKGTRGSGPDEFIYPQLVPTPDPDLYCYLYEMSNNKLYTLDKQGKILRYPLNFSVSKSDLIFSISNLHSIDKHDFMFIKKTYEGQKIFRITKEADSTRMREVYDLNLKPELASFVPYYGSFALNPEKKRMVYAYRHYKIIKFMDLDAKKVKSIDFKQIEFDEKTMHVADGLDMNVTHYYSICEQPDHVYVEYIGFKPGENKDGIIYIEQYDWEGNPVRKFKLDHPGLFAVDEKSKKLYLLCRKEDDPFYVYSLP